MEHVFPFSLQVANAQQFLLFEIPTKTTFWLFEIPTKTTQ